MAGWIGHPAVAREVARARPALNDLVASLLLPDQGAVTLVAAHFLGGAGTYPDGSEWPNPFIGAPADVRELAEAVQPRDLQVPRCSSDSHGHGFMAATSR